MKEPTPKMKKAIENITLVTGIRYRGATYDDARKFISEHIDELRGKDIREYKEPTPKMMDFIEKIQRALGIPFEGSTMKDAAVFIDTNLPALREVSKGSR